MRGNPSVNHSPMSADYVSHISNTVTYNLCVCVAAMPTTCDFHFEIILVKKQKDVTPNFFLLDFIQ